MNKPLMLLQHLRRISLGRSNQRLLRRKLVNLSGEATIPVFFVFIPEIVHFAPYSIPQAAEGFEPVLVLNAVSVDDELWLRELHPQRIIIRLKTSLSGNPNSVLAHGEVLNELFAAVETPFCIQDPDCFVIGQSFWDRVILDTDHQVAAGPFFKKPTHHDHVLPDTHFLVFNSKIIRRVCARYGVTANVTKKLRVKALRKVAEVGYLGGHYPQAFKDYYDTLQAIWVLALAEGFSFKKLKGAGQDVFHIGGTSYLHKSDYDLAHWDYWPLSVIYFNLKLLELPAGRRFQERFAGILDKYESSEHLLSLYPQFKDTQRYREMQIILNQITS
jgi:hypothetical protein